MALNTHEEIELRMGYTVPTPDQIKIIEEIRHRFRLLAHWTVDVTPPCREQAMFLTNIELAQRDAIAAVHHGARP